jgi:cytochrome c-type biogenesis protein CcmF
MPWLAGAALIHSQAATEKRGSFAAWTLLLAIAAFSLSLLGTFLVRSGVMTSVHAFASDPQRGLFILGFLGAVVGSSLLLFALRAPETRGQPSRPASRETFLLFNNLLLTVAFATILLGTLFPLLAEAMDWGQLSVGSPFFGLMFTSLMAPLLLLLPFGPLLRWGSDDLGKVGKALLPGLGVATLAGISTWIAWPAATWKTAAGVAASLWVGLGTLRFVVGRLRQSGRLTPEMWGMSLAHAGVAFFVAGVLLTESTSIEKDVAARPGETFSLRGYDFSFRGVDRRAGPNYLADHGVVVVERAGEVVATLEPQKRAYASGGALMTEAAMHGGLFRDLYVALGEPLDDDGSWSLRLYVKPFIRWIWFGALLMALGAFTVMFDRRFGRDAASGSPP